MQSLKADGMKILMEDEKLKVQRREEEEDEKEQEKNKRKVEKMNPFLISNHPSID